jgi:hypothetical protein
MVVFNLPIMRLQSFGDYSYQVPEEDTFSLGGVPESDSGGDRVEESEDNCPESSNAYQEDS